MTILINTLRLLGVQISNKKKIYIGLTSIYGIGITTSLKLLNLININPNFSINQLTEKNIIDLRKIIMLESFKFEGFLKKINTFNIKRLIDIKSFKGRRHLKGLPVRGQRTRTNSRTCRRFISFSKIK
jgi:small subunit ribosomal protein S13